MSGSAAVSELSQWIETMFAVDPAADELEFEKRWTSWGELDAASAGLSRLLEANGIAAGTRIGVLLRNRAPIVAVLLALFRSDRCLASINAAAPVDKLAEDIVRAAAPVYVALESDWQNPELRAAASEVGALAISLPAELAGPARLVEGQAPDRSRWTQVDGQGLAIEMLSSGTTGTPKRIPLSIRKFEAALRGAAAYEKGRAENDEPRLRGGVQIVTAPLAHIAGITAVMNNVLAGRKICLIEKFTVETFRDAVVRHRPKVAGAPPSALKMLFDANLPKEDLSSLVAYRTGTAPLDPDLADAFYERYGIPVLQNYGATEFAGGAAGWTLPEFKSFWKEKRGSVGRVNKGIEARVIDPETGEPLSPGETGLLELKGGNIGSGDWVRTTDLAVVDADRFLFIKGRADGAIIRGGFKILPEDVVKALESHPAIREAAVAGIADERLGQVPVAAYAVRNGAEGITPEALRDFLKERLMPYQVPVRFREVAEFPRTPSMKVSLPGLRALFAD